METLICWWGQRSHISVNGHLRSSCKIGWKCEHGLIWKVGSPIGTKLGLLIQYGILCMFMWSKVMYISRKTEIVDISVIHFDSIQEFHVLISSFNWFSTGFRIEITFDQVSGKLSVHPAANGYLTLFRAREGLGGEGRGDGHHPSHVMPFDTCGTLRPTDYETYRYLYLTMQRAAFTYFLQIELGISHSVNYFAGKSVFSVKIIFPLNNQLWKLIQ